MSADEKMDKISAAAGPAPASFVAEDAIYEWWINDAFTWLGDRLVATLYGANSGDIRAIEWRPGEGITTDAVVANSTSVDDHNTPGHWAAEGERAVLLWQRHNADSLLRIQVSNPGPDMASFAETPIVEVDMGAPVTYAHPIRIAHLSDPSQNTFWCPTRLDNARWRILEFRVDKATGAVTVGSTYFFLSSSAGQCYCSFADARADTGNQTLRVAFYHNPAVSSNMIWYVEIDCVTGEVISPFETLDFNLFTALNDLEMRGSSDTAPDVVPAIAHDASVDRRLFYAAAGPCNRRIAYAEWPASNPDAATYKVLDLDRTTTTEHGAAGMRFGYRATANYLPGMCFDNPAHDDTIYLARNPDGSPATLERHRTTRSGATSTVLLRTSSSKPIRPIRACNGGPFLMYFDLTSYGIEGTFLSTGAARAVELGPDGPQEVGIKAIEERRDN